MKTYVGDINSLFSNLLEAHNSLLIISVRRYFADKLRPVFALLNRLEGVSKAFVPPKQGEEANVAKAAEKPKQNELKVNVASCLKGKGPMVVDDEEDKSDEDQLNQKTREHEINERARIAREA